jgi:hypothetical protein
LVLTSKVERLNYIIDFAWEVLFERITSGRIKINKESSMQLHYSTILHSLGELLCIYPGETFSLELESAYGKQNIDIICSLDGVTAAVELKCFRKSSNRAQDLDMYDVWVDIDRLSHFENFDVKRFICLTDHPRYPNGKHNGYSETFSIAQGVSYKMGDILQPKWVGKWKDKSRDNSIIVPRDIDVNWTSKDNWFYFIQEI